eukprot:TRINITY_DN5778_c0_g2_i2.p1 TRINITY_DN5778_c0_g2~~TRINITY_DN5778_c0_g2_i2.p1  ORF type:complete len:165 (+),score=19.37 TRINITY_DN5778_c0_g2_i2:62-496(+)
MCIRDSLYIFKYTWAGVFHATHEELESLMKVVPIYILGMLPDWTQCILGGILRAISKQGTASAMYFICFYGVSQPLGYYLAFVRKMSIVGIWVGFETAICILSVGFTIALICTSWDKQIKIVQERIEKEGNTVSEAEQAIIENA